MKKYLFSIITILLPMMAYADITGVVKGEEEESLAGAIVTLLSDKGDIMSAVISDKNGNFAFENIAPDSLTLLVSCSGYEELRQKAEKENILRLRHSATELDEVEVISQNGNFETKAGRFIYTPGTMAKKMPNAMEALGITPLLDMDAATGSLKISFKEENAIIYINGRLPKEPQDAVRAMLRATPVNNIRKIEIWPNPGSYVSGTNDGGIVNVELQNPNEGFVGSVSSFIGNPFRRVYTNDDFFVGYKKGKVNMSLSGSYSGNGSLNENETRYHYKESGIDLVNNIRNSHYNNSIRLGYNFKYNLSEKSSVGFYLAQSDSESHSHYDSDATTVSPDGTVLNSHSRVNTNSPFSVGWFGGNLFYTYKIDSRNSYFEVLAGGDKNNKVRTRSNKYFGDEYMSEETVGGYGGTAYAQAQLTKVFANNSRLHIISFYNFRDSQSRHKVDDMTDNYFRLRWHQVVGRAGYRMDVNQRFGFEVGVGCEYNIQTPEQRLTGQKHTKRYFDFLPFASLNYSFRGGRSSLMLSYRNYVFKPSAGMLNPLLTWSDEYTGSMGNMNLTSQRNDMIMLNYVINRNLVVTVDGSFGGMLFFRDVVMDSDKIISMPFMGGHDNRFSASVNYNKDFFGIWNLRANSFLSYNKSWAKEEPDLDYHNLSWSFRINNRVEFIPEKGWFCSLGFSYRSPRRDPELNHKETYSLSFGLSKNFMNCLYVDVSVYGFFKDKDDYFHGSQYDYRSNWVQQVPKFRLMLTYSFGNQNVRAIREKSVEQ